MIAHVVRGEPAFDVATRFRCPVCEPIRQGLDHSSPNCDECDNGYWWIIPTSGHRAYPYWGAKLENIDDTFDLRLDRTADELQFPFALGGPPSCPKEWPDHYACNNSGPSAQKADKAQLLKDIGL